MVEKLALLEVNEVNAAQRSLRPYALQLNVDGTVHPGAVKPDVSTSKVERQKPIMQRVFSQVKIMS